MLVNILFLLFNLTLLINVVLEKHTKFIRFVLSTLAKDDTIFVLISFETNGLEICLDSFVDLKIHLASSSTPDTSPYKIRCEIT